MTGPAEEPISEVPALAEAIADEGKQVVCDLLYSEKAHFAAAERLQREHHRVGLAATLLAAAAAATVFAGQPVITGILALGASIASGLLTFLKPDKKAASHLATGRELGALRVELRQLLHIDLAHQPFADSRSSLGDITSRKADLDRAAPATTERDFRAASSKIDRGDFEA